MGNRKRPVPLLVIHADGDRTVSIRAARRVRDTWGSAFGADTSTEQRRRSGETAGTPWMHKRYADGQGQTVVETLFLEHAEHGWYGGRDGKYGFADAPDVAAAMWQCFARNRLGNDLGTARADHRYAFVRVARRPVMATRAAVRRLSRAKA